MRGIYVIYTMMVGLSTSWAVLSCKDGQYHDDVMNKCFSCKILCRGDTLHGECPTKCSDTYRKLQEAKQTSTVTLTPKSAALPAVTPVPEATSSRGGPGVQTFVIIIMVAFVIVGGVVVSGGFIWYRWKPRRLRQTETPRSESLRASGYTSLSGSRDAELAEPFLGGGSLPTLSHEETFLKSVARPASAGDLARVHFYRSSGSVSLALGGSGSVTLRGNPVMQPQEHPQSPTGNPFTESQRFRSESDAMFREMRETTV